MEPLLKVSFGWVGFKKSYVINRVGETKILCLLTRWVGGSKKGQKYAYVIYEWSLTDPKFLAVKDLLFFSQCNEFQGADIILKVGFALSK